MLQQTKSVPVAMFKAVKDAPAGTFEAIVSVFGNRDKGGDVVKLGAFADSIAEWRKSGDPIPVIFSHAWGDLHAHIGVADPQDVKELEPGDPQLPEAIRENGGLYAKAALDVGEPQSYASRVWQLLERRSLKQFSFAYNVVDGSEVTENEASVYELRKLDLLELGPTLIGMNPATELLSAKALRETPVLDLLEFEPADGAGAKGITEASARELVDAIRSMPAEIAAIIAGESPQTRSADGSGRSGSGTGMDTVAARAALELVELETFSG